jgi:alanine or glycine:cation symporter, AGCS family
MEAFNQLLCRVDDFLWSYVLVTLLLGTGIYLTLRMRLIQVRGLWHGVKLTAGVYDRPDDPGDLKHFHALSTALSATVGIGNIAGVAIAIQKGGPGAMFWMWMTAALGMATKFTCCTLAVKFRNTNPDGTVSGGPMYYIENGLGKNWKWLAVAFASFASLAAFGVGCMAQAGEMARSFSTLVGKTYMVGNFDLVKVGAGLVIAVMTGVVIIGGIKRIGSFTGKLVPFMCVFYVIAAMLIIFANLDKVPGAFFQIFHDAFTGTAAVGGFTGAVFIYAMRMGVARGIFSNESGMGSAPIAHATAKTNYPIREGYVALLEPFIDTIIICSMTGLVVVITGAWTGPSHIGGAELTAAAFSKGLAPMSGFLNTAFLGKLIVTIGVILFAYSTAISWSYYGDRSISYLLGLKSVTPYRYIFCFFLLVGASIKIDLVWNLCDILNGMMALPNLVSLWLLAGVVRKEMLDYLPLIPGFDREIKSEKT